VNPIAFFSRRMHRKLMLSFSIFALALVALFGLFAMAFVYTVEDRFIERWLQQEALRLRAAYANERKWLSTSQPNLVVIERWESLPADLARTLTREPSRTEIAGDEGRHYHVVALDRKANPPWLVAEVSEQLMVRPMRDRLLVWLIGWGIVAVVVALLLAWILARRTSAPLEAIASRLSGANPSDGALTFPESQRLDEVGEVARGLESAFVRLAAFVEREQAFTRDASHELRTPLAVLRASIERMRSEQTASDAARLLNSMHGSVLLMQQTVETLLQVAREDVVGPQIASVLPIIERWVIAHAAWLDIQGLALDIRVTATDQIALPESVASLVVANLLHNAFAHGAKSGSVTIESENGVLRIANPIRTASADALSAENATADGAHGFGLTIVRRLLERYGAKLNLTQTQSQMIVTIVGIESPLLTYHA
jgi:signal transduction histidine kinase